MQMGARQHGCCVILVNTAIALPAEKVAARPKALTGDRT